MDRLSVKITPNAKQSEIVGWITDENRGDVLRIKQAAPPIDGKANRTLIKFLADCLGVSRNRISIVRGLKNRSKTVEIDGLSDGEFRRILADLLA